jgi:hypothetical protein
VIAHSKFQGWTLLVAAELYSDSTGLLPQLCLQAAAAVNSVAAAAAAAAEMWMLRSTCQWVVLVPAA